MGFLTKGGKPMPFSIMMQGCMFCFINGFSQSYYHLLQVDPNTPISISTRIIQLLGLGLFFFGFYMNHESDMILRNLRKDSSDHGYYIPQGGFFKYWSSPNLIGEIIEWWGFALFSQTLMATGFAFSTMFIIGNRAYGHHQWYLKKFTETYPKNRRSLIPGVI